MAQATSRLVWSWTLVSYHDPSRDFSGTYSVNAEWYRHHQLGFIWDPENPRLRNWRWRKPDQICAYRSNGCTNIWRHHGEAVAGNSSEAVRDQPSRFTVWRLIVSPSAGSTRPGVLAIASSNRVSRPTEGNNRLTCAVSGIQMHSLRHFVLFETYPASVSVRCSRFTVLNDSTSAKPFPRNLALVSVLYLGERPEMTSHDEEPKKAKTRKLKQKETTTMKTKLTKMIMSSLAFACALVCLAAAMAPGTSATARAEVDRHCSVDMLRGLYLFTFDGYANFGGNLRTESRYARPPVQRRWYARSVHSAL